MTDLTQQIKQSWVLGSPCFRLASIVLVLLALQAAPANAQCAAGTACWTTTDGVNSNSTNTGNVGIGTSNPATKLEVVGEIRSTDSAVIGFFVASAGGANSYLGSRSNHGLRFRTNDIDRLTIDSAGNVGIGPTLSKSLMLLET